MRVATLSAFLGLAGAVQLPKNTEFTVTADFPLTDQLFDQVRDLIRLEQEARVASTKCPATFSCNLEVTPAALPEAEETEEAVAVAAPRRGPLGMVKKACSSTCSLAMSASLKTAKAIAVTAGITAVALGVSQMALLGAVFFKDRLPLGEESLATLKGLEAALLKGPGSFASGKEFVEATQTYLALIGNQYREAMVASFPKVSEFAVKAAGKVGLLGQKAVAEGGKLALKAQDGVKAAGAATAAAAAHCWGKCKGE